MVAYRNYSEWMELAASTECGRSLRVSVNGVGLGEPISLGAFKGAPLTRLHAIALLRSLCAW